MNAQELPGLGRRRFIQAAGGVLAAPVLAGGTAAATSGSPAPGRSSVALPAATAVGQQEVGPWPCDLTRRWLHVEPLVDAAAAGITNGLVAAWPCDEGGGYAIDDVTGGGNPMFLTGSRWNTDDSGLLSAFRRQGRRGGGIFLDGTRWLAARARTELDVGSRVTVSGWVRLQARTADQDVVLLSRPGAYALRVTPTGAVTLTVTRAAGGTETAASAAGAVPVGQWTFLAGIVDGPAGRLEVYRFAQRVAMRETGAITVASTGGGLLAGRYLNGSLDELAVHRRLLDAAAVRQLSVVGLPRVYAQTQVTVDAGRQDWSRYAGSDPVPHPNESDTVFSVRFDDSAITDQGGSPTAGSPSFQAAWFGGGLTGAAGGMTYPSPLPGTDGTFEAWYVPAPVDGARSGELFRAVGGEAWLALSLDGDRWRARLGTGGITTHTVDGPAQRLVVPQLEHVAVCWGDHGGQRALALSVNGVEAGRTTIGTATTTFGQRVVVGSATGMLVDDVRISNRVRGWGEICPRGHASTDAAGIDLRDDFDRADDTAPVCWRAGAGAAWTYRTRAWEDVTGTGADPDRRRALVSSGGAGLRTAYHPDAFGNASSIEAGVAFDPVADGWAGVFAQASDPGTAFAGYVFAVNPGRNTLRIARYANGAVAEQKTLPYDFTLRARTTYTLTLTSHGDGLLRGFVDGHNLISWRVSSTPRTRGYAGLVTHGVAAYFDDLHFTPLTPAVPDSRLVRVRVQTHGPVGYSRLWAQPFRWHKRPGLLPWHYDEGSTDPEPAGNIAGADTAEPPRPIPPALWRSEDSANSDVLQIDGRFVCFMRGNLRQNGQSFGSRIGVLDTTFTAFDGVHFDDPSRGLPMSEAKLLEGADDPHYPDGQARTPVLNVNNPGSAYIGDGKVLVCVNEIGAGVSGYPTYRVVAYGYYDLRADDWTRRKVFNVPWSAMNRTDPQSPPAELVGTPELVAMRHPDTDEYRVVLFHQTRQPDGTRRMTTVGLAIDAAGVPRLDPQLPPVPSISRTGTDEDGQARSHQAIYNFRVLFDNGIYYLHYSEGPHVPDWPHYFVLVAALDPYAGPWARNPGTDGDDSTYFRRGGPKRPDNGAIWHGDMIKHRGDYYLYYENYHSISNLDPPPEYPNYDHPQAGSRLGFATA